MIDLKNIPVDEFTSREPVTVRKDTSYQEVAELMRVHQFRHLVVTENDDVIGVISERNLKLPSELKDTVHLKAEAIMAPEPYTVGSKSSLDEVAFTMSRDKIGSAVVVDESGKLLGIFTSTDALNALVEVIRGDV